MVKDTIIKEHSKLPDLFVLILSHYFFKICYLLYLCIHLQIDYF